jgi:GNAT superfamily N-acetyltransferase
MSEKYQSREKSDNLSVKIEVMDDGREIGRGFLYLIRNDLHERPYGLIEDVFVEEEHRKRGIGTRIIKALVQEAGKRNCYKVIFTSRNSKPELHQFYEKLGFEKWGVEFRKDREG